MISCCDYFDFGFGTLDLNALLWISEDLHLNADAPEPRWPVNRLVIHSENAVHPPRHYFLPIVRSLRFFIKANLSHPFEFYQYPISDFNICNVQT